MVKCDKCGISLSGVTRSGDRKILIKSRALVISAAGQVQIRCHECKHPTKLPLIVDPELTAIG